MLASYRSVLAVVATATAQPNRAALKETGLRYSLRPPHINRSFAFEDTGGAVQKNIKIGLGKSVLLEFPRAVRDVMVSNPSAVDAVVLSSNRVFLLGTQDRRSERFLLRYLGRAVRHDGALRRAETRRVLKACCNRLIPGSNIKVEMLNQTVILTGSVKSPIDSVRASEIAKQFAADRIRNDKTNADAEGVSQLPRRAKSNTERIRHQHADGRGRRAGDAQGHCCRSSSARR